MQVTVNYAEATNYQELMIGLWDNSGVESEYQQIKL